MSITHTWSVSELDRISKNGIVYAIRWVLRASKLVDRKNFEGKTYQAEEYETVGDVTNVPEPEGSYIPYEDLTEEIVIGWVKTQLGQEKVSVLEDSVAATLEERLNPKTAEGTPWS